MDLVLTVLATPSVPAFAGALCATGTFMELHKPLIRKVKRWLRSKSNSIRNKCKKKCFRSKLRYFRDKKPMIPRNHYTNEVSTPAPEQSVYIPELLKTVGDGMPQVLQPAYMHEKWNKTNVKFLTALSTSKQLSAIKIAEGTYAEIYTIDRADGSLGIFKCTAIGGQHPSKNTPNLPLKMAVPDIVCSATLSQLNDGVLHYVAPNFPKVFGICIVRDKFPETLMRPWWAYKNSPERLTDPADHPQPDLYEENQTFLTIESSFCGIPISQDISKFQDAWLGASILTQLVAALSVAEQAYSFEHRDLHLGNILLQRTWAVTLKYRIMDLEFAVKTIRYQVFIIDFNLSRINEGEDVHCVDMDQVSVVEDEPLEEQAENIWLNHNNIYGLMAEKLQGDWDTFVPGTNIMWLKYTNENILNSLQINNPSLKRLVARPGDSDQMKAIRLLHKWNDCILEYDSATSFLHNVILKDNPLIFVYKP